MVFSSQPVLLDKNIRDIFSMQLREIGTGSLFLDAKKKLFLVPYEQVNNLVVLFNVGMKLHFFDHLSNSIVLCTLTHSHFFSHPHVNYSQFISQYSLVTLSWTLILSHSPKYH